MTRCGGETATFDTKSTRPPAVGLKGRSRSQLTSVPNSEIRVDPYQMADQRCRLYQDIASDWCQAFDMDPCEFARLRALCLQATRDTAFFEDLLGHGLDPEFQPETR